MKAHELIATPDKWCKKDCAQDFNGTATMIDSPDACKFCVAGAILKCYSGFTEESMCAREILSNHLDIKNIGYWNDTHTHAEVLAVLKELDI